MNGEGTTLKQVSAMPSNRSARRKSQISLNRRLKESFKTVDAQVPLLAEETLNEYLGWMAQWLALAEKHRVVRWLIKMRVRSEARAEAGIKERGILAS